MSAYPTVSGGSSSSSPEVPTGSSKTATVPGSKRRRLRNSCDKCKQRKIRCDSSQMPGNRCSHCIAFNTECTHTMTTTKPTLPPKASVTVDNSPSPPSSDPGIEKSPKAHVAAIVIQATSYIADSDVRQVLLDVARYARNLENELATCKRMPSVSRILGSSNSDSPSPTATLKEEESDHESELVINGILTDRFDRFSLDSDRDRYFGKSSFFDLLNTAIDIKKHVAGDTNSLSAPSSAKRFLFWRSPWEYNHLMLEEPLPSLIFPDQDLLRNLVDLYFARVNIILLLFHRPSFERSLASGLHLVDRKFGCTVLGICALGAKYSDDPRVILEGTNTPLSAGWKYFCQIYPWKKTWLQPFTLYEAQTLCLNILYMQGSSVPDGCWTLGGAGVRYAQEAGIHRRSRYEDKVLDEQWKRVFWVLICIDTLSSSFCGRPRATCSDDYDIEFPEICDDEYWLGEVSDPCMAFKQPDGEPSLVSFFVAYLKLIEIMGMAQKTIYLVNQKNYTEEWIREAVSAIDSSMNAWIDSVPVHLRWDPHMEHPIFSKQSAVLYACYYHVQIATHKAFLGPPGSKPGSPLENATGCHNLRNYPSLSICASSARACSHVMDIACQRGLFCNPHVLNAVFDSCIFLLLSVWAGRFIGLTVDSKKCLQDVESCLRVFRAYETRWQMAGRQHDILLELMNATHMEGLSTPDSLKRGRDDDADISNETEAACHRPVARPPSAFTSDINALGTMHTEDLGRLPMYEPFNWDSWGSQHESLEKTVLSNNVGNTMAPSIPDFSTLPSDSMALFTVPNGYDWDDWGKYITSVEELMQSFDHPI